MNTVAIADDELFIRKNIQERIKLSGENVEVVGFAANGPQAVLLFQQKKPDIFFVDINMPFMNGLDFIAKIDQSYPNHATKFIIISGYDSFSYLQKSIRLGVADYICKPILQEEFNQVLKSACTMVNQYKLERKAAGYVEELIMYSNLIDSEEYKKPFSGMLLLCQSNDICLTKTEKREELKEQILNKFPTSDLKFIAFAGVTKVLMILCGQEQADEQTVHEMADELTACQNINVVYAALQKTKLQDIMEHVENTLNYRMHYSGAASFSYEIRLKKDNDITLDSLDIMLERCQKDALKVWIEKFGEQIFASRKKLLWLNHVYQKVILLMLDKYIKYSFQMPDTIKQELWPFAMAKYKNSSEVLSALNYFANDLAARIGADNQNNDLVENVSQYLQTNYAQKISLQNLSNEFFVSPTYLSMRFKQKMSITISQYLENIRMEKSKEYLSMTESSVSEISEAVGYDDASYFTRVFRKTFNLSPHEYRQKNLT